jgi:hypothetical protein
MIDTNPFTVADELDAFPGAKPKWKGATKYLENKTPAARESSEKTQVEDSDSWESEAENAMKDFGVSFEMWKQQERECGSDASTSEASSSVPSPMTALYLGISGANTDKASATKAKPSDVGRKGNNGVGSAGVNTPETSASGSVSTPPIVRWGKRKRAEAL